MIGRTPFFNSWLNLFLASNCPLCQRPTAQTLCLDCDRQLQRCRLARPQAGWQGTLPLLAWGTYSGPLKRTLAALKYDQQPQLARPLGQALGQAWLDAAAPKSGISKSRLPLCVVPIPMHADKQRQRGYNQAILLAESFCEWTRLPLKAQGLERIRATEAQFNVTGAEREHNVANAFAIGKGLSRHSTAVLLLDDIYTTGATARSAAQTLRQQGILVHGMVAIAQAQSH